MVGFTITGLGLLPPPGQQLQPPPGQHFQRPSAVVRPGAVTGAAKPGNSNLRASLKTGGRGGGVKTGPPMKAPPRGGGGHTGPPKKGLPKRGFAGGRGGGVTTGPPRGGRALHPPPPAPPLPGGGKQHPPFPGTGSWGGGAHQGHGGHANRVIQPHQTADQNSPERQVDALLQRGAFKEAVAVAASARAAGHSSSSELCFRLLDAVRCHRRCIQGILGSTQRWLAYPSYALTHADTDISRW